jgi:hypothetical protein
VYAQGDPSRDPGGPRIHDRVFHALPEARTAALDVFISDSPSVLPQSRALGDPKHRWVGVGAIKGDSLKYGKGKYWVVVLYAGDAE